MRFWLLYTLFLYSVFATRLILCFLSLHKKHFVTAHNFKLSQHILCFTARKKCPAGKSSATLKNLKDSQRKSKEAAYCGLVRSSLEYGSTIWDSHLKKDVANLEKVNRRALRFVMNDHKHQSSVPAILDKLQWPSLEHRRKNERLTTMFKIVHGLVAVPSSHLILADSRTNANHIHKFKNISAYSTAYKNSFFTYITSVE